MLYNIHFALDNSSAQVDIQPVSDLHVLLDHDLQTIQEFLDSPHKLLLKPFLQRKYSFSFEQAEQVAHFFLSLIHQKFEYYQVILNSFTPHPSLPAHFLDQDQNLYVLGILSDEIIVSDNPMLHKMSSLNSLFNSALASTDLLLPFLRLYKI